MELWRLNPYPGGLYSNSLRFLLYILGALHFESDK